MFIDGDPLLKSASGFAVVSVPDLIMLCTVGRGAMIMMPPSPRRSVLGLKVDPNLRSLYILRVLRSMYDVRTYVYRMRKV